jgi:hypothetical protein
MNRRIGNAQALHGSMGAGGRRRWLIPAALVLGLLLGAGWGGNRTAAESEIEALRRAAAEGDAGALFSLADRHERGDGLEHDLAAAAAYLRLAAERGHPEAQYRLGLLYAGGVGLPEDRVEGYRWLSLAADADEDGTAGLLAEALRAALSAEMAPEELERGEELAAAFSPIHGPAELPALEGVTAEAPTLAALEAFLAEISCDEVEPSLCRVLNLLREHPTKLDPEMDDRLRDLRPDAADDAVRAHEPGGGHRLQQVLGHEGVHRRDARDVDDGDRRPGLHDALEQVLHHDLGPGAVERPDQRQREDAVPELHHRRR